MTRTKKELKNIIFLHQYHRAHASFQQCARIVDELRDGNPQKRLNRYPELAELVSKENYIEAHAWIDNIL